MSLEPAPALPPAAADAPAPAPQPPSASRLPQGVQPGLVAAWLLAAVALTVGLLLWQRISAIQQQLARQSAEASAQSIEARTLARQADDTVRAMNARLSAAESRLADMSAYRSQLDELVQTVARARDENLPAELETALRLAQDQAQLTGSVALLQSALRGAERRLARSQDPRLLPVARALARDTERVKTAAVLDTTGLLARLDQLLGQIDHLPAANAVGHPRDTSAPEASAPSAASQAAETAPPGWWQQLWHSAVQQARELVRISTIDRPEAALLTPEQAFFLRENLKLRLQSARLALLARQYEAARADLAAAASSLHRWFDPAARRTQQAASLLQSLQFDARAAELPRVDDTLTALANAASLYDSAPLAPDPAPDASDTPNAPDAPDAPSMPDAPEPPGAPSAAASAPAPR